ncbi:DUF2306 domain-containing protein [Micromonospora sp. NPDC047738]|uniref:DUF2306 domain-containing protein n=1 Tax=Micromonospora sp. NPDC047738 TaxID=3155741 RepID=UPI0033DB20DD
MSSRTAPPWAELSDGLDPGGSAADAAPAPPSCTATAVTRATAPATRGFVFTIFLPLAVLPWRPSAQLGHRAAEERTWHDTKDGTSRPSWCSCREGRGTAPSIVVIMQGSRSARPLPPMTPAPSWPLPLAERCRPEVGPAARRGQDPAPLTRRPARLTPLLVAHIAVGSVALIAGCFQVWPRPALPGRAAVDGSGLLLRRDLPSGASPCWASHRSAGSVSSQGSNTMLAVRWLATAVAGYRMARQRRFVEHRRWMIAASR